MNMENSRMFMVLFSIALFPKIIKNGQDSEYGETCIFGGKVIYFAGFPKNLKEKLG